MTDDPFDEWPGLPIHYDGVLVAWLDKSHGLFRLMPIEPAYSRMKEKAKIEAYWKAREKLYKKFAEPLDMRFKLA